ncbi:hypothetical protein SY83_17560 [Paenibacillus swuensis]|uniref:Uncharacterized protein n=1 Tax=Paenibacillus swuensis TaxID=1178515 RepID=A0A172TLD6_9BACL|nr:hypothetical protein [Paenibacillus swuensis]ANE47792.1 hypothetical protein SY83_17560 [Paenibacillus swuensis]
MSRLTEIIQNHHHLSDLFAIVKHYGVSAEFVAHAMMDEFEHQKGEDNEELEQEATQQLMEDLKLFCTRF